MKSDQAALAARGILPEPGNRRSQAGQIPSMVDAIVLLINEDLPRGSLMEHLTLFCLFPWLPSPAPSISGIPSSVKPAAPAASVRPYPPQRLGLSTCLRIRLHSKHGFRSFAFYDHVLKSLHYSTGGLVFAMQTTVVKPPAAEASPPSDILLCGRPNHGNDMDVHQS